MQPVSKHTPLNRGPIVGWFHHPIILQTHFTHYCNMIGYVAGISVVIALAVFVYIGYIERPIIISENLIEKIVNPEITKSWLKIDQTDIDKSDVLYTNPNIDFVSQSELLLDGISIAVDNKNPSSIFIPLHYLNIPNDINSISITMAFIYDGDPILFYGFRHQENLLETLIDLRIEITPNPGSPVAMLSTPTTLEKKDIAQSWDNSDYFSLIVTSNNAARLHIEKILITGYY